MFETVAGGGLHQRLDGLDVSSASYQTCLAALADYERCAAQLAARQQELLARIDQIRGITRDDWTREEVAAALRIAPTTAGKRLTVSRIVYHRLTDTWRLLRDGRITGMHARLLAGAVEELTEDQTTRIQEWVLRRPDLPIGEFDARIRHAVATYAPVDAEQARADARRGRTCWHTPVDDETGTLVLHGPVEAIWLAWTVLDDHAHQGIPAGDDRTVEQRRFDAFTDLFLGTRAWEKIRPTVEVTVPLDALLGGGTPGELVGYGPICPDTARDLAGKTTARWRRLVTDPATGALLACGPTTYTPDQLASMLTDPVEPPPPVEAQYRPSAVLARFVRARDRYCRFPGCRRKARRAELDHTTAWPAGETSAANLHALCKRHHRLKHETDWTLTNNPDGSTWTSPTGTTYTVRPHDYNGP